MKIKNFLKLLLNDCEVFISIENVFSINISDGNTRFYDTRNFQEEYALWLVDPGNKDCSIEKLIEQLPDWVTNANVKYWWPARGDDRIPKRYDTIPIIVIGISDSHNGLHYNNGSCPITNFVSSYEEDEEDDWVE